MKPHPAFDEIPDEWHVIEYDPEGGTPSCVFALAADMGKRTMFCIQRADWWRGEWKVDPEAGISFADEASLDALKDAINRYLSRGL